jgi:hypothetical protein
MFIFDMVSTDKISNLQKLEKHYILKYNANLNTQIPGRTVKQYYQDNYETRKQQMRNYNYNNKTKCKELMKQNYMKKRKLITNEK